MVVWNKIDFIFSDTVIQSTHLKIFFKEQQFMTLHRSESYTSTNFIADCGGLLGLFLGVSLLSIIEIIYHFTLRLGCSLHLRRFDQRSHNVEVVKRANTSTTEQINFFNTIWFTRLVLGPCFACWNTRSQYHSQHYFIQAPKIFTLQTFIKCIKNYAYVNKEHKRIRTDSSKVFFSFSKSVQL